MGMFAENRKVNEKFRCSANRRHGCIAVVLQHLLSRCSHKIILICGKFIFTPCNMKIYHFQKSNVLWIFGKIKLIDTHSCIYSSSTVLVISCSVTRRRAAFACKGDQFPLLYHQAHGLFVTRFCRPTLALPGFSAICLFPSLMKTVLFVWKRCSGRKMSNQISQAAGMLFPNASLDVASWGDAFLLCWVIQTYSYMVGGGQIKISWPYYEVPANSIITSTSF